MHYTVLVSRPDLDRSGLAPQNLPAESQLPALYIPGTQEYEPNSGSVLQ